MQAPSVTVGKQNIPPTSINSTNFMNMMTGGYNQGLEMAGMIPMIIQLTFNFSNLQGCGININSKQ